jgi:hypothetical protein
MAFPMINKSEVLKLYKSFCGTSLTKEFNGTAERKRGSRWIYPNTCGQQPDMLWCMLHEESLTSSKKSHFELWFCHKPGIHHFTIYGCKACMHVSKQKRKSLDDRAEECIVVGYCTGSTYRLMTKKTRTIVIALDVKFDEASLLGYATSRITMCHCIWNTTIDDQEDRCWN